MIPLTVGMVRDLYERHNMCVSHGVDHSLQVLLHTQKALECVKCPVPHLVELAALLHDVDDEKFFNTSDYENARTILQNLNLGEEDIETVVRMISYVSASKNGDRIPEECIDIRWELVPRWADRIEACGMSGVRRAYQFNVGINSPLFVESTLKPKNIEDVWNIATSERYLSYRGNSKSMIDNYYDKLLHIWDFPTTNPYFISIKPTLLQPLLNVIQAFIDGKLTHEFMIEYTK